MKVGVLTGGGDCPGLNAVIRAIVRKGTLHYGDEFVGYSEGWRGVLENKTTPLNIDTVTGILPRGGTILRTSRTNPAKKPEGVQVCIENMKNAGCDALICLGGDDTQSVAQKIHEMGFPVVGVPKTIDNDLSGTDFCFGFDTAVTIATDAIDRLHTTAEAHNRVIVVEVMGRDAGWIAMYSGIAGGADVILIPERPFDIDQVPMRCGVVTPADATSQLSSSPKARSLRRTAIIPRRSSPRWQRTNSVTCAWAASATFWRERLSTAPALKLARWCSATYSAAELQRHSTACSPRVTAWARSTRYTTRSGAA